MIARSWFDAGAHPQEVAYLGFTKAAARAAASKMLGDEGAEQGDLGERFPLFRTLHSLAYMGLRRANPEAKVLKTSDMKRFAQRTGFDGEFSVHEWEDLSEVYQKLQDNGRTIWDQCSRAYTLSRICARTPDEVAAARVKMSPLACRTLGFLDQDAYEVFVEKYEVFKSEEGLVDFTDMLTFALESMAPLDECRFAIVDEAQDLSPILHAIVDRIFRSAEEIWWVGDDYQCQPGSTMVKMFDGSLKKISAIRSGDYVLSWDRGSQCILRRRVAGVASRPYRGRMFRVEGSGRTTLATPNHKFVIRWRDSVRFGKTCITYLMRRGDRWRVGWCQLFNAQGALHLGLRMNIEKADAAWVLGVHGDRTNASIQESVIAARYGLPTATFEPVNGAAHLTKESINRIFSGVGDRATEAARCLEDYGRSVEWPFIDKVSSKGRHRSTLMEVRACNLLPGLMMVPLPGLSFRKTEWTVLECGSFKVDRPLQVYSLDVEKSHTYVADGIITHNCIYGFAAASAELFLDRAKTATHQVILRQTHRFGQSIVDFSDKIIKRVQHRMPKEIIGVQGKAGRVSVTGEFKPTAGNQLILHRHVAGCQAVAATYIDAGLPFSNERGKDPLGAKVRVRAWRALDELAKGGKVLVGAAALFVEELLHSMVAEKSRDGGESRTRFVTHGGKKRIAESGVGHVSLDDLEKTKILTEEGVRAVRERQYSRMKHAEDLEYYDRVIKNGYDLDAERVPTITTIHGAKGRQADGVTVFSEMGRRCWEDPDTEHRLAYVAATRTKGDLEICADRRVEWAASVYDYPVGGSK